MKPISSFITILFFAALSFAGQYPTTEEKIQARLVIKEVENISKVSESLDAFGRGTLEQGKKILGLGAASVYTLASFSEHPDWKVRFWIADILGYLNNPDAARPLERMIENRQERKEVRLRAAKSLKRLNMGVNSREKKNLRP